MLGPSLYHILGVERDATQADIKVAWRTIAKANHPDLAGARGLSPTEKAEREEVYRKASAANAVLSSPEKRREYNRELDAIRDAFIRHKTAEAARPRPRRRKRAKPFTGVNLEDIARQVQKRAKTQRLLANREAAQDRKARMNKAVREMTLRILAEAMLDDIPSADDF